MAYKQLPSVSASSHTVQTLQNSHHILQAGCTSSVLQPPSYCPCPSTLNPTVFCPSILNTPCPSCLNPVVPVPQCHCSSATPEWVPSQSAEEHPGRSALYIYCSIQGSRTCYCRHNIEIGIVLEAKECQQQTQVGTGKAVTCRLSRMCLTRSGVHAGIEGEIVRAVAASRYFSMLATASGEIWSFGGGFNGELGFRHSSWVTSAQKVEGQLAKVSAMPSAPSVHDTVITATVPIGWQRC